jgi:PAS domain S-box-containing protein
MDLIHPEDAEKARSDIAEIMEHPDLVKTREYRLLHKDGSYCDVQVTGANLKSNKSVGGILLTSHDVTAQKWAEEALRQVKGSFAAFINDSSFGYVEVDLNGNLTFANRRAAEIPGRTIEELLKMNFKDIVAAEDHERAAQKIGSMPRAALAGPEEYTILGKDGRTHHVEVTTLPIVKSGKRFGLQLTFADITERKLAQEALAQSEARFRELADLLPEIVYEMDETGALTYVNKCAFAITGYSPQDLSAGFSGPTIFVPEDRKRARDNMNRIMRGEADEVRRYTVRRKDGSTFPALARSTPIIRDGKAVGLRGIIFKVDE